VQLGGPIMQQIVDFDYKFKPGFKIALGNGCSNDDWGGKLHSQL